MDKLSIILILLVGSCMPTLNTNIKDNEQSIISILEIQKSQIVFSKKAANINEHFISEDLSLKESNKQRKKIQQKKQKERQRKHKKGIQEQLEIYPIEETRQTIKIEEQEFYLKPTKHAKLQFEGGIKAFVKENLEYPTKHDSPCWVYCYVSISKDGKLLDYGIVKKRGQRGIMKYNLKALECIEKMENWNPAIVDGKPIYSIREIRIGFPEHKDKSTIISVLEMQGSQAIIDRKEGDLFKYNIEPEPKSYPINEKEQMVVIDDEKFYLHPTKRAELQFVGGISEFVYHNLKYPNIRENGLEGTVFCYALISKEGKLIDGMLRKNRSIGVGYSFNAIECVKKMEDWNPAYYNGKPVNSILEIPIRFTLSR